MDTTVYDFIAKNIKGVDVPLKSYEGKVMLIVNTASKCGFTPQFKGLEELYEKYRERGFVILGFPCDQFAHQDPGTDEEILQFCEINYGVTFPMFSKINVRGSDKHPLYKYLIETLPGIAGTESIKWNFTKFLIDRTGHPVKRYAPQVEPWMISSDIEKLL